MEFIDLGIPVDAVESRTAAICTNLQGESRIVIAAKGFLLVISPESGQCWQLPFPEGHVDYPYDCFSCSKGMFYTGAGTKFYALDPFLLIYIANLTLDQPDELCGFSYAEDAEGFIYVTSYPRCQLYQYSPSQQAFTSLGSVDDKEKYPSHMAVDEEGWIYIGTGTVQQHIMALHSSDRAVIHQLMPDRYQQNGIGLVRQGPNQQVFARIGEQWFRLKQGKIGEAIEAATLPDSLYHGSSFGKFHRQLQGSWKLESHSLSEYKLVLRNEYTEEQKTLALSYSSKGAMLSPIVLGPDQKIYGTSNHPLHFYSIDPKKELPVATNYGATAIEYGAGGNIAAYAVSGSIIAGAAYTHGRLHLIDTSKPIQFENKDADARNPICVASHIEIHRPRCAIALSDDEHIAYGGFPGYGMIGGGLGIYHLASGKDIVLTHDQIAEHQSTVALAEDAQGNIIGATSIETPGGAEPVATTACLYKLDWRTQTIKKRWMLRDNVREYSLLLMDKQERLHIITSSSMYMVFDPCSEEILCEHDLANWGGIVRQGWQLDEEENCIYGVLSKAVYRICLDTLEPHLLATPPQDITAGFVKYDKRLFFAVSTHLYGYTI